MASSLSFVHSVVSEMTKEGSSERLGQLEMTPVSRAIARHMCIDLSPEGLAARNRRGIAIIVYGAPLIGEALNKVFRLKNITTPITILS